MARACYFALITELDAQLGRLLGVLEETDQAENTLVIVAGDHGLLKTHYAPMRMAVLGPSIKPAEIRLLGDVGRD